MAETESQQPGRQASGEQQPAGQEAQQRSGQQGSGEERPATRRRPGRRVSRPGTAANGDVGTTARGAAVPRTLQDERAAAERPEVWGDAMRVDSAERLLREKPPHWA